MSAAADDVEQRRELCRRELKALAAQRDALTVEVRRRAVLAVQQGLLSEVQAAAAAGTTRPTLRKWLGK